MSKFELEKRDGEKPSQNKKIDICNIKESLIGVECFLNNFCKITKCVEFYNFFKK